MVFVEMKSLYGSGPSAVEVAALCNEFHEAVIVDVGSEHVSVEKSGGYKVAEVKCHI